MGGFFSHTRGLAVCPWKEKKHFRGRGGARNPAPAPPGRPRTCPCTHVASRKIFRSNSRRFFQFPPKKDPNISAPAPWSARPTRAPPHARCRVKKSWSKAGPALRTRAHVRPYAPMIPRIYPGDNTLLRFSTRAFLKLLTVSSPNFYSLILFSTVASSCTAGADETAPALAATYISNS